MDECSQERTLQKTTAALAIMQMFSMLAFASLYSTLVLYQKQKLGLSLAEATAVMGSFGAFNYGMHVLGGCFGGRLLSWRMLFIVGMILQIIGCVLISIPTVHYLYRGLAFYLVGSGLNITCLNMMVTQLFEPGDRRRDSAFLWNYSSMNLGFLVGFTVAGYFQLIQNFHLLFLLGAAGNVIATFLTLFNWKKLHDKKTTLTSLPVTEQRQRLFIGLIVIALMVLGLSWLISHANKSNILVLVGGAFIMLLVVSLTIKEKDTSSRHKMFAYLILMICGLAFWTLYQLVPMALTIFAQYNVNRHFLGFLIAPQWIININSIVIILGGPFLVWLFKRLREKNIFLSLPFKISLALLFAGTGIAILPLGIHFASAKGYTHFDWIFVSYILQSMGELLIGPIGYAMIGQLAPQRLQGLMMGTWMMMIGIAAILANYASQAAIKNTTTTNPLITNAGYAHTFSWLGGTAITVGILLLLSRPLVKQLTKE